MTLSEKAKDLRSSGCILTICGLVGMLFMVFVFTGVIPLNMSGVVGIVARLVMCFLFMVFLVTGIMALKRSGIVMKDAEREAEKKNEILKWFMESFAAKDIDALTEPQTEENELYFERIDIIRDKICERFMDVEDALMSELTEEIYTRLFETGE